MKNLFKKAHEMTREMVQEYGVDYQAQFGLNLSYLLEIKEEEEMLKNEEDLKQLLEKESKNIIPTLSIRKWEKYGKSRTYINLGVSAHNREMTYYIDNDTNKVFWMDMNETARWTIEVNKSIYETIKKHKEEIKKLA